MGGRRWIGWVMLAWLGAAPSPAAAFGAEGHRITGLIAAALLTDQARAELSSIVGSDDLAALSLVADERRAEFSAQQPDSPRWHYDDRLVCHPDLPRADYCPGGACASAAVEHFRQVLADRTAPRSERAMAVLFLVHIVGDIHQPLHAADNNDRGGNAVRVRLPGDARVRSLHAVWDVDLVRLALAGRPVDEVATSWRSRYTADIGRWQTGTVESWLLESYRQAYVLTYGLLPAFECDRPADAVLVLTPAYVERATALQSELLTKAGARIAAVLNDALSVGVTGR